MDAHEPEVVFAAMDRVMQHAYGVASFRRQIEWFRAVQPDGLFVAEDDGTIVGTGCGIAYPDAGFGWVGLVSTAASHERRGIGTMVTDRVVDMLASHGCAPVLDASVAGQPVYARMGFTVHGTVRIMTLPTANPATGGDVEPITASDRAAVCAYDAGVFGADRSALLHLLIDADPNRCGLVRAAGGGIAGFVVGQASAVGPLAADDADVLAALLGFAAGLDWPDGSKLTVPPETRYLDDLAALGCTTTRELRHMRRGAPAPPDRAVASAQRSPGSGVWPRTVATPQREL